MKLIIHIGTPKTGTTAIQSFLRLNYEKLLQNGCIWLKDFAHETGAHYPINWAIENNDLNFKQALINEVSSHSPDSTFIVSSEMFTAPRFQSPNAIGKTLSFFNSIGFKKQDIKIVIYIRRQDEYFESIYNERVKNHFEVRSIYDVVAPLDYLYTIGLWREFFGKSNIKVKLYDKFYFKNNNIFDDFLSVIDVEDTSYMKPENSINLKLDCFMVELFRRVNALKMLPEEKRDLLNRLSDFYNNKFEKKEACDGLISRERKKEILQIYKVINKKISEEYFQGNSIFDEKVEGSETDYVINHELMSSFLLEFLGKNWHNNKSEGLDK